MTELEDNCESKSPWGSQKVEQAYESACGACTGAAPPAPMLLPGSCLCSGLCVLRSSRLLYPKALHEELKLHFSITPKSQMEKGIIGVETAP